MPKNPPAIVRKAERSLEELAKIANAAAEASDLSAIEAGEALTEAKARLGHGEWLPWLAANFRQSERTAVRLIDLAKSAKMADLKQDSPTPSQKTDENQPASDTPHVTQTVQPSAQAQETVPLAAKTGQKTAPPAVPERRTAQRDPSHVDVPSVPMHDRNGIPVPDSLKPVFAGTDFHKLEGMIRELSEALEFTYQTPNGAHLKSMRQAVTADVENLKRHIRFHKPHAICPRCDGGGKKCVACKGYGWVYKSLYEAIEKDEAKR